MKQIEIKGPIVSDSDRWFYDWMDMPATAPKDVVLPVDGSSIEVIINSGGGDVYAGSEIYTMLKSYAGEVVVKIVGIAASAASVIAMAGDRVEISPTAQLMIHNVSTTTQGDHIKLLHEADVLENYNQSIANSYRLKTKLEMTELLDLMNKETWFTSEQAVAYGFADVVMFEEVVKAPQLVAGLENIIPSEVIAKFASIVNQKQEIDYDRLATAVENRLVERQKKSTNKVSNKGFGAYSF
ncbi:head maturation protease, ClpP-related [Streptococcus sp. sy004]|uniref:head maturation protease, ClpP-related n=1 Tax=Streptococcus sp. sy004 TaxID=2600149 RepID=UPI0011B6D8FD|nr:head maturation protease, ClpP-related [Streptococcus sp. sy004]TWT12069.1 Clp protease ClpP [Streptococcus sp. sy004]